MESGTMLLEADWIVPINGPPFPDGAVLICDGHIQAVGPAAEMARQAGAAQVRAFPGCALLPGLINAHSHLDYSAFLGFSPSCGFGEWMLRLLRTRRKLSPEDYAVSARWGAEECLRNGITCIADTSFEGWTAARAAGEAGLRARVYLEVIGLDEADVPGIMERMEERLAVLQSVGGPLVEVGLSPHAPYTVSWRLYREIARYAAREGLHLATHVAESPAEVELLESGSGSIALAYKAANLWKGRRWTAPGLRPVAHLVSAGALGPATLAVHCVHLDADDIRLVAEAQAGVAHCPRSNAHLCCGIAPVAELRAAGVHVGLGTDSLASNASLDMFAEMRAAIAAAQSRSTGLSASQLLTPADVLRMATIDGARALGWADELGTIEAGKRADLTALRLPDGASGAQDLEALIVSCAFGSDVNATLVEGRFVFEAGPTRPLAPAAESADVSMAFDAVRRKLGLRA